MRNVCFLATPFSNENIADIWNFKWIKYLGKGLSYLKKWGIGVKYCWSYGPSNLLLDFSEYRLDQLNSKHTKIAVNSAIQYCLFSKGYSQKEISLKSLKLFGPCTTKRRLCGQYFQTSLISDIWFNEIHNMCKIWFANKICNLLRWSKKYFSWFFKGFQMLEGILCLQLYWPLKKNLRDIVTFYGT